MINTKIIKTSIATLVAGMLIAPVMAMDSIKLTDSNGDGVISAEEITQVRDKHKAAMLQQYDADGNGELSRLEKRAMKDDRYAEAVANFDTDGDGELSRDERKAAKQARRAAFKAQLDVNQDGVVSDAESAVFDELREGRGWKKRHGKKS